MQLLIDGLFVPCFSLAVLTPFKIADGDAATVAEDRGQDCDATGQELSFAFGRGGCVGSFDDDFAIQQLGLGQIDHLFERSGDEEVHRQAVELLGRQALSPGESRDSTCLLHMQREGVGIDGVVVHDGAGVVHDGAES